MTRKYEGFRNAVHHILRVWSDCTYRCQSNPPRLRGKWPPSVFARHSIRNSSDGRLCCRKRRLPRANRAEPPRRRCGFRLFHSVNGFPSVSASPPPPSPSRVRPPRHMFPFARPLEWRLMRPGLRALEYQRAAAVGPGEAVMEGDGPLHIKYHLTPNLLHLLLPRR